MLEFDFLYCGYPYIEATVGAGWPRLDRKHIVGAKRPQGRILLC